MKSHLISTIAAQNARHLGQYLSPAYERVRARIAEDAKKLLTIEYRSCLKVARSKKMLRRIHNLSYLKQRLRFLAEAHGEPVHEEMIALISREHHFRVARYWLRKLRSAMLHDETDWSWYSVCLKWFARSKKAGDLSNRALRTTAPEILGFERQRDKLLEQHRERRSILAEARATRGDLARSLAYTS